MGSAKGGQEVVERIFIGQIYDCDLRADFVSVAVKQIVVSDGQVEKTPRGYAWRILVVIFSPGSWHLKQRGTELRNRARILNAHEGSRMHATAEQTGLELLIGAEGSSE